MTLLSQQELLEPQPSRRIIVPRGHSAWWGVDPSTLRVAVAGVSRAPTGELDRWVETASFAPIEGPGRLAEVYGQTHELVMGRMLRLLRDGQPLPGFVFVEQPGGAQRNFPLYYAVGATVAAIDEAVYEETGHGHRVRIEMVVPGSWKKRAIGYGSIYKPKKGETHEYGVLTWAKQNSYAGSSWDEADAWGIAEAARRTVALDER